KCLYCPTEKGMPKSYLSNEPAVMRAIANNFDPYSQIQSRIKALELNGHATDKIELIVMGGTFSHFPAAYQQWFITECFRACNEYPRKIKNQKSKIKINEKLLIGEQIRNEKAKHRIIGLTLETRPDYINEKEIINFRKLGCTRVELGVQSIFNDVLWINKRGHNVEKTIEATKLLKDAGFKINYHIMPGLPGSNLKNDYRMFKKLFSDPDFQPDMLKIYPTVVVKSSPLYKIWKSSAKKLNSKSIKLSKKTIIHFTPAGVKRIIAKYKPLRDKQFSDFIVKVKNEVIPPYVRISRLVRDVPATSILAGPKISNLRQIIIPRSKCRCIRCREVGADYKINERIVLDRINYKASGGDEIFLQYVSPDKKKLFALLRLRIPKQGSSQNFQVKVQPWDLKRLNLGKFWKTLRNAVLIREVHTYGKLAKINKKDKSSPQHIGLGKKLMREAERIAKEEFNLNKIVVISGIGVRDYYRRLGYRQKDTYMVKNL
ncbi:MAG: hypothetical protein A3E91_00230, partial [Candidatus Moranbacteria bacterium RIFCSPHIGHO2_12_FULL_40_10]